MRFSVGLPVDHVDAESELVTGPAIAEMAAAAEAAGFDAAYVTDHPAADQQWLVGGGHHALEPLVGLAFAAASTTTLRLQTHVYVAAYRNPFLAAKGVATLDALSGGRVILGVAAGYLRPEFGALGVDFDERNELLDECIEVMRRVWTEDEVEFEGRHFKARAVTQRPRPASRPTVPIWIGGNSARAMRRAVELGDGWVPFPNPPAAARATKTPAITSMIELAERLGAARDHADKIGRTAPLEVCFAPFGLEDDPKDYEAAGVTWLAVQFDGHTTRAGWIDRMREYAATMIGGG
ncbi:MAG TPA: LLM class F420-dependent oxidoreductase [Acidimicrobiia bacterium]|jgi:probable F420-dependent oxidoreductase